ncbi:hypothetical protein Lbir_2929 [Legionella birminghamensis]|uniref:Uncharacterized protein n=2 Tax=Legionella birminghamensis TaxID=28083 RepID=A0A378I8B1_9GAMM|nr:hypothetical protein [Legionella birminghamensis]KTC68327.1 hypothetical protein Lbir_2929 [Legionella birminghamensis]STX30960.1 Uncharacterised protein [Legionella birminghamensis]
MPMESAATDFSQSLLKRLSEIWTFAVDNDFKIFLSPLFMRLKLCSVFSFQEHHYIHGFIQLIRSLPEGIRNAFLDGVAIEDLQLSSGVDGWRPNDIVLTYLQDPDLASMADYVLRYQKVLSDTKLLRDEIVALEQAMESKEIPEYISQLTENRALLKQYFRLPAETPKPSLLPSIQNAKGSPVFSAASTSAVKLTPNEHTAFCKR